MKPISLLQRPGERPAQGSVAAASDARVAEGPLPARSSHESPYVEQLRGTNKKTSEARSVEAKGIAAGIEAARESGPGEAVKPFTILSRRSPAATTVQPQQESPTTAMETQQISTLVEITGCEEQRAKRHIKQCGGDFAKAINAYIGEEAKEDRSSRPDSGSTHTPSTPSARVAREATATLPSHTTSTPSARMAREATATLPLGLYVCTKHYKPQSENARGIEVMHGDVVELLWSGEAGQTANGWAWVTIVGVSGFVGYYPQKYLAPAPPLRTTPFPEGERLRAVSVFEEPPGTSRYLPLAPNDEVVTEYPTEYPHTWAYVSRLNPRSATAKTCGWVPLCIFRTVAG